MPEDSFNLSPQQEQLWLAEPYGPSARVQAVITFAGELDAEALREALSTTVQRHEALRTTFVRQPGLRTPLQVIHQQLPPLWRTLDVATPEAPDQAEMLERARKDELAAAFDFSAGPLVRAVLATYGPDRNALVLTLSSLVADPVSILTLLGEAFHHYCGAGELVEQPIQYADYAEWQRELSASEEEDARCGRAFWSAFEGAASPSLPFTRSTSSPFMPEELAVEFADPATAIDPMLVQAAWLAMLGRVTHEDSVVVGVLRPRHRHPDLEGAIGAFGQALPMRACVTGETRFADLSSRLQQEADEAAIHEIYAPFELGRGLEIGFLEPGEFHAQTDSLEASLERVAISGGQFRLWLTYEKPRDAVRLRLSFDPRWLAADAAGRLARRLELMVRSAAADAGVELSEPDLLDEAERNQLLIEFNDTAAPIPPQPLHELIAAHAAASPGRIAAVGEQRSLTYAELDARANQLAHRLRRAGVGPDVPVGLCTDRSIEMVVGLLAILKAGGAYLPLHYEHPRARLRAQLETAGARAMVTLEGLLDRLPDLGIETVCLDREADRVALDAEPRTPPEVTVSPDRLAYIIYTSGSTGTPKGVGVTHRNLVNYVTDIIGRLGAGQEPLAFGMATSISTDLGNTSLFGALCSGGTVVLLSPASVADSAALARQLAMTPIDVLKITPSHLGALLIGRDPNVLPRRWLVLGGERAQWDLIATIRELSGVQVLNHYGPTETTVGSCAGVVGDGPGPFEPASVPIGRPIANTSCYVLDERFRPTPLGVAGKLFIAGAGVARGYIGQPELTAERFISNPFARGNGGAHGGGAMYDTGDFARWLPDRTLEFLGRADDQVKIRGYRVELAEVESALRSHDNVNEAVVVTRSNASGDLRLVAYCTTDGAVSEGDLGDHLANWLPEYMLPSAFAILAELPRTPSGKVDRLSLPDPATLAASARSHVAPRTPIEHAVAAVWSRMLGEQEIGVEDDFFELGGHSLLATQTIAQLRNEFGLDIPLHAMFLSPTVESLAAEIVMLIEADAQGEAEPVGEVKRNA